MPKSRGRTTTKKRTKGAPQKRRAAVPRAVDSHDRASPIAAVSGGNCTDGTDAGPVKGRQGRPTDANVGLGMVPARAPAKERTAAQSQTTGAAHDGSNPLKFVPAEGIADGRLQVGDFACTPLDNVRPQGLALTYWFDAEPDGDPYPMSIRFTGKFSGRLRTDGEPAAIDQAPAKESFEIVRTLDTVVPGSGRIAFTNRILGLAPGEWQVSATPTPGSGSDGDDRECRQRSTRHSRSSSQASGVSSYGPVVDVSAPGTRLGAWPALVSSGALIALITLALLAARQGLPVMQLLAISLVACLMGLVGAKWYYLLTHRAEKPNLLTAGMCIQGFVIAAIFTIIIGGAVIGIPIGPILDVITPGLLLGMSVGRLGCFFGGCCAGRPSASRWAVWSSDRTLGVRRFPVQLVESAMSGLIGFVAFVAVALGHAQIGGTIFLAAIAANTLGRQLLFPMRIVARSTAHGRTVILALSGLTLVTAMLITTW